MGKEFKFIIEYPPHLKSKNKVPQVMLFVVLGTLPSLIWSVYLFRFNAIRVLGLSIFSCFLAEYLYCKFLKKPLSLKDLSFLVTGILYALTLPPSIPSYPCILGGFFSIIVGKMIFGGLGQNIFNPALVGRAFLTASFPVYMTSWIRPFDGVSCATPLNLWKFNGIITPLKDLFFGLSGGSLGEMNSFLLLLGGLFLIFTKTADFRIPLSYLGTVFLISSLFYLLNPLNGSPLFHLFSGGLMLGAFFMATDPVTSPYTKLGKIIFGIGCGIICMSIRYFGGLPEGVMFSILFMNALTPLINKVTKPKSFGR